jgi:serine/threonine protein kinase
MFSSAKVAKQNEPTSILNDMGHKLFRPIQRALSALSAGGCDPSNNSPSTGYSFTGGETSSCCDLDEVKSMTPSTSGESPSRGCSEYGLLPSFSDLDLIESYAGEPPKLRPHKTSSKRTHTASDKSSFLDAIALERCGLMKNFKFVKIVAETLKGAVIQVECRKTGKSNLAVKYTSKKRKSRSGFSCFEDPQKEFQLLKTLQQGDTILNLKRNNIIPAWEFAEDDECFCTVMDLAQCDLFEVVKTHGNLQESQARSIFKQVCQALQFLKSKRICHLDVSLENILMDRDGNCFLSDFGLAQEVLHSSEEVLDFLGPDFRPGKPKYMAPEIVKGEIFNGFQADMYSLGIVLFCMLYGFHPYQAPNYEEPGYVLISSGFTEQLLFSIDDISISDEAQDLICNLLCPEVVRYSLEEVMLHEWLRS